MHFTRINCEYVGVSGAIIGALEYCAFEFDSSDGPGRIRHEFDLTDIGDRASSEIDADVASSS